MDVRSCRRCKKLFNYVIGPHICPNCREELEAKFVEVKKFLVDNPSSDIMAVAEACDVEVQQITSWIREERLQFADSAAVGLGCERCDASIKTGRFCDKCKAEMAQSFSAAIKKNEPQKQNEQPKMGASARMRFLDN